MEMPTDVEVSTHHGAARTVGVVVLAAREAQHGARLHEGVAVQNDAGLVQGLQGDHREVPVEVDGLVEANALLQEERDASGELFGVKTGKREPVMRIMQKLCESCECQSNLLQKAQQIISNSV